MDNSVRRQIRFGFNTLYTLTQTSLNVLDFAEVSAKILDDLVIIIAELEQQDEPDLVFPRALRVSYARLNNLLYEINELVVASDYSLKPSDISSELELVKLICDNVVDMLE